MKKFRTIISALAAAAVITTIPAQAAIEMYNPLTMDISANELMSTAYSEFRWASFIDTKELTTGLKTDEDGKTIVDTYDGSDRAYVHVPRELVEYNSSHYNYISLGGEGYSNVVSGDSPDEIAAYESVYGKMHSEVIARVTDPVNADASKDEFNSVDKYFVLGFDTTGARKAFNIYPYYITKKDDNGVQNVYFQCDNGNSRQYLTAVPVGNWFKMSIDVDVPNDLIVYSIKDLNTGKVKEFNTNLSMYGTQITNVVCGSGLRMCTYYYGISIDSANITRDTFVVNDLSVTDTDKVVASAKMANHGTKTNNRFNILYADGTTYPMYPNVQECITEVDKLCQKTPMLILAQYDADGRLIACSFNKPEKLESTAHTTGKLYVNPGHTKVDGAKQDTERVNWQDVTIELDKASGYSYAKAYVWTGLDTQKPYLESVSTK